MGTSANTPQSRRDSDVELLQAHLPGLKVAFDSVPFAVWARDRSGRIVLQNAELARVWGAQSGKLPEEGDVAPDVIQTWKGKNKKVLAGRTLREEVEHLVEGEVRVYDDVVTPLRIGRRVVGIIGFLIDITERKDAEAALRRFEHQALSAAELERQKIGRDLHDGIGQIPSGLAFCAGSLHTRLVGKHVPEAAWRHGCDVQRARGDLSAEK